MEIKNNLETKIKSLTKPQIKFIDENEDLFFSELKKVLKKSHFKEQLREYEIERKEIKKLKEGPEDSDYNKKGIRIHGVEKWKKIKKLNNTSFNFDMGFDIEIYYMCDINTKQKIHLSIHNIPFEKKVIEKGFFSNKITWEDDDCFFYTPLGSYSGYKTENNYNDLLKHLKNPSIRLKYNPKDPEENMDFILIKNINKCLYNFFDTIDIKIKESQLIKIK